MNNYAHTCKKRTVFILHGSLVFLMFKSMYLKYLDSLQSERNLSLASQKICDHNFQIQSQIILSKCFFCVLGLYIFLSYLAIFHLLRSWGGVGIHFKLIINLIKLTPAGKFFPAQYITKL